VQVDAAAYQAASVSEQSLTVVPEQTQPEPEPEPSVSMLMDAPAVVSERYAVQVDAPLDPVQLMQHPAAEVVGSWDSIKWEYWLRERDLSPAVRNLAQHGVLSGQIDGQAVFQIAPEHQVLAVELFDGLQVAFAKDWPDAELTLQFEQPQQPLPMQMKQRRYEVATARARELVLSDAVIAPLMQVLDAQIIEFELKDFS